MRSERTEIGVMSPGRKTGLRGFTSREVVKEGVGKVGFAWNQKGRCAFGIIDIGIILRNEKGKFRDIEDCRADRVGKA
jgi:hypothetical protein